MDIVLFRAHVKGSRDRTRTTRREDGREAETATTRVATPNARGDLSASAPSCGPDLGWSALRSLLPVLPRPAYRPAGPCGPAARLPPASPPTAAPLAAQRTDKAATGLGAAHSAGGSSEQVRSSRTPDPYALLLLGFRKSRCSPGAGAGQVPGNLPPCCGNGDSVGDLAAQAQPRPAPISVCRLALTKSDARSSPAQFHNEPSVPPTSIN
ncbi:hypothetical protein BDA96_03G130600 [Sorghum bicolor]|uniref:Uncharacterized protein n=2 Tax=Sorghum bicolor TaxID=4558 RepID=A0A921RDL8_SORBI|nr:hypothetical protein BDA96_03G130600 [Sorghum bicolor]KXG32234.2 hypothetical protein SORBI_3003G125266 [Sorghum bicolor]